MLVCQYEPRWKMPTLQVGVSLVSSQKLWCGADVSCDGPVSPLPHCRDFTATYKCKEDRTKEREKERGRQSNMFLFYSGQTNRRRWGLIGPSLQHPHLSFDDPSHHLFPCTLSSSLSPQLTLHIPISWISLCFCFSSPPLTFCNTFCLFPLLFHVSSPPLKCFRASALLGPTVQLALLFLSPLYIFPVGRWGVGSCYRVKTLHRSTAITTIISYCEKCTWMHF